MDIPVNTERNNWSELTPEDATAGELHLIHLVHGPKPNWMSDENWRSNMRACAQCIRDYVAMMTVHK